MLAWCTNIGYVVLAGVYSSRQCNNNNNNHLYSHKQLHVHGTYKALCTKLQLH